MGDGFIGGEPGGFHIDPGIRQQVLYRLETADRSAELLALPGICDCQFQYSPGTASGRG